MLDDAISRYNPTADNRLFATLIFVANILGNAELKQWNQESVLIQDVKVVEGPDGTIPSLVGLYNIHDEVRDPFGGLLYQPAINGRYKIIPCVSNGKSRIAVIPFQSSKDHLIDGKIQSSFQIMQGITDYEREVLGHNVNDISLNDIVSGIRIRIDANSVRATADEFVNPLVNITDVILGPL